MDRGCFFCRKECSLNSAYNHINHVYSDCKQSNILKQICNDCSYIQTCKKDSKGDCASNRKSEIQNMATKTDEQIIEYLKYIPSVNCPNDSIDLTKLTIELAEEEHYEHIHSSDDWDCIAKDIGITKSEEDYIREDFAPGFVNEAKEIIAKKEAKYPSLNFSNMDKKTSDCFKCPPEIKNKCSASILPESWMSFPDLYMAAAIKRGLMSKIR